MSCCEATNQSVFKENCLTALGTPTLSSAGLLKLMQLHEAGAIDWPTLWPLILKYGALAVQALEQVLPLVGVGAPWTEILGMILAILSKLTGKTVAV